MGQVPFDPLGSMDPRDSAKYQFWLKFWRWVIVAVQVVIGGIALVTLGLGYWKEVHGWILGPTWAFFALAMVGGLLLATNRPLGVILSLVVQALQLLQINIGHFSYAALCGPSVLVGLFYDGNRYQLAGGLDLNTQFQILWDVHYVPMPGTAGSGPMAAAAVSGVNVVAGAAIICLLCVWEDQRRRLARRKSHREG